MAYGKRRYRGRRGKKRTYRRRRFGRRYRKKPATMRISHRKMPTIFPDAISVVLPYSTRLRFSLTAGTGQNYTWRLNSLFQPDPLVSLQPQGFDQWTAFYNDYCVYASSIRLEFITDINGPIEVALGPDGDVTPPLTIGHAKMLPYYRTKVINGYSAPRSAIGNKCAVKVLEGHRLGHDNQYVTFHTSNPTSVKYWQFMMFSPFITGSLDVRVTIWYKARLSSRLLNQTPS